MQLLKFVKNIFKLIGNYTGNSYAHWGHALSVPLVNLAPFIKNMILRDVGDNISKNYIIYTKKVLILLKFKNISSYHLLPVVFPSLSLLLERSLFQSRLLIHTFCLFFQVRLYTGDKERLKTAIVSSEEYQSHFISSGKGSTLGNLKQKYFQNRVRLRSYHPAKFVKI